MELPISTLIILAVAIVVLLSIVSFFMGTIGPTGGDQARRQAFSNCCVSYVLLGCPSDKLSGFTCNVGGTEQNLAGAGGIAKAANINDDDIPQACGCIAGTTGGGGGFISLGKLMTGAESGSSDLGDAGVDSSGAEGAVPLPPA